MAAFTSEIMTIFLGFFAIMNPIANTAAFAGLVGNKTKKQQAVIARKALLITFIIIVAFALLGNIIFHLFGITLTALRITGGILVFIIGYHMLNGSGSTLHSAESSDEGDVAVSPLAVPLLAGPGTIATAMNFASAGGVLSTVTTIAVFALLCVITYGCFIYCNKILSLIGDSGLSIITRLMGLILAVIGTQMLIEGVNGVIASLQ
ncbi:MAG: MarC family protein [Colwellia sp.]